MGGFKGGKAKASFTVSRVVIMGSIVMSINILSTSPPWLVRVNIIEACINCEWGTQVSLNRVAGKVNKIYREKLKRVFDRESLVRRFRCG